MTKKLIWKPQPAFAEFFYTNTTDIINRRTVFREDISYFVPHGGRGSGKTFTFIDACVIEASIRPVRILCTRELQISIEESIKAEIEAAIASNQQAFEPRIVPEQDHETGDGEDQEVD